MVIDLSNIRTLIKESFYCRNVDLISTWQVANGYLKLISTIEKGAVAEI